MFHDWDHNVFRDKLCNRKRFEDGIRFRDVNLLVDWIWFGDWNVFSHVFHDDLDRFGILDMSILVSSVTS